jgi:F0F1-type ATP synthase assembly protein I
MKDPMADDPSIPNGEKGSPPKKSGPLRDLVKADSMVQLALAVPAGCFVGLGIGYLLDRHFHTRWIVVAGMLLGAAGGFIQIFNYLARSTKGGDQ